VILIVFVIPLIESGRFDGLPEFCFLEALDDGGAVLDDEFSAQNKNKGREREGDYGRAHDN